MHTLEKAKANPVETTRLSWALGAEVHGVDLSKPLSQDAIEGVRQALNENLVLVFRNQTLTPKQHVEATRQFGQLMISPGLSRWVDPEYPEVFVVTNKRNKDGSLSETRHTARKWHSDQSFMKVPSLGSLLYCVEKPKLGGDTMFANMYLAYDELSETMKKMLDGLQATHNYFFYSAFKDGTRAPFTEEELAKVPPVSHPVIRTHPETKKKLIFTNESITECINGLTESESKAILSCLFDQVKNPRYVYRHHWQVGDVVFWDNRATQHMAPADYDIENMDAPENHRLMRRTTIKGTEAPY